MQKIRKQKSKIWNILNRWRAGRRGGKPIPRDCLAWVQKNWSLLLLMLIKVRSALSTWGQMFFQAFCLLLEQKNCCGRKRFGENDAKKSLLIIAKKSGWKRKYLFESIFKYTELTWPNNLLRIATTCLQRPPFCSFNFNLYNAKLPMNYDQMTMCQQRTQIWGPEGGHYSHVFSNLWKWYSNKLNQIFSIFQWFASIFFKTSIK